MSASPAPPARGYEARDASPAGIAVAAGIIVVSVALAMLTVGWMLHRPNGGAPPRPAFNPAFSFRHGAEMRTSIEQSWTEIDATSAANLHAYRWRNRAKGEVQIPIERAMELLATPAEEKK